MRNASDFFAGSPSAFDLVLLGIGADGHTASLFPYTAALAETSRLAVSNWVEKLATYRLTMTFPMLNNAANVIFLVAGEEKAPVLKEILEGDIPTRKISGAGSKTGAWQPILAFGQWRRQSIDSMIPDN